MGRETWGQGWKAVVRCGHVRVSVRAAATCVHSPMTGDSPRGRPTGEGGHARARVNPAYLPASAPAQGSKCGRLLSVWVRTSERCPFKV